MAPPLAVTMGDPAGIGGDIALGAWLRRAESGLSPFFVIDDAKRLERLAARLNLAVPIAAIDTPTDTQALFATALPVLHRALSHESVPGLLDPRNSSAIIGAIELAVSLARSGQASAVVTNPINKKGLYDSGFKFPGHTEFLASLAGNASVAMMLAGEHLKVVPVTIHLALSQAISTLTTADIVRCGRLTADALRRDFGVAAPRLAVAGLNPHAGEGGALGREDIEIVAPAISALRALGVGAFGPLSADTMFHEAARATYDAALCMYHDQALIPIKTLDFDGAVNVTLGLPFIRTSPDHGTALDIAGTGKARPDSLIAALKLAHDIAARHAG